MRTKHAITISAALSLAAAPFAFAESNGPKPEDRKVLFGEQHMHTRNSFDAFTAGVQQTWEQAYQFL